MPLRYLKPGIRDSTLIEAVQSPDAEILYYRLIASVDDFGRFDGRPSMVKAACFPIRERATSDKCAGWMQELETARLLVIYEVEGKPYLQLTKWDNKPRAEHSKYPDPPPDADKCMQPHTNAPLTVTVTDNRNRVPEPTSPATKVAGVAKPPVSPPDCPHEEILKLYHQLLPELPEVAKWTPTRRAYLQARWREDKRHQSLEWWEKFFNFVKESDFLCGKGRPKPGQKPFMADLEWLITQGNFVKVIERKYHTQ